MFDIPLRLGINRMKRKEMHTSEICNLRSKTVDSAFMLASQLELIEKKKNIFKAETLLKIASTLYTVVRLCVARQVAEL